MVAWWGFIITRWFTYKLLFVRQLSTNLCKSLLPCSTRVENFFLPGAKCQTFWCIKTLQISAQFCFSFVSHRHLSSLHFQLITMVSIARISSYLTNQISMNEAASTSGPFTLSVKDINTSGGQWYVVTFNSFLTHLIKTISYSSWCGKYGHQRTICPYLR